MTISDLISKLRTRKPVEQHLDEKREEWIADVSALMAHITAWLRPLNDQGLVRVESAKTWVSEPDFGQYEADTLTILMSDRVIRVDPRGGVTWNRVDVISGPSRASFRRAPDRTWQVARVDGRDTMTGLALDAEVLADVLLEMVQ